MSRRQSTIQRVTARLNLEPLWRASLGSMELFHSNMLEYLALAFPIEAKRVFSLKRDPAQAESYVRREHRHLDLIVALEGLQPLVIENKLFDFPDADQLRRYDQKLDDGGLAKARRALLSLMSPTERTDGSWEHISYGDLGRRLTRAFRAPPNFSRELMRHWGELCRRLQELSEAVGFGDSREVPFFLSDGLDDSELDAVEVARVRPFSLKLRAHELLGRSKRSLPQDERLKLAVGYTNGTALLEGFVPLDDGDEAGWQLQGNQWRLAVRVPPGSKLHGRGDTLRRKREEHVGDHHGEHFDFSSVEECGITVAVSRSRKPFLHFAPDFVYRRVQLQNPTVGQLESLIVQTSAKLLAISPS